MEEAIMKKLFLVPIVLVALSLSAQEGKRPLGELSGEKKLALMEYLKKNWKSPEEYVVSKFKDHDLVFIGEYHRIKHDVELIHNLIPKLYEAGVHNLGIEFGCYEYQNLVDSLLSADEYDEERVRQWMFKWSMEWGYEEYLDIYRTAWELNRRLENSSPKFRIVNLGYRVNWKARKEEMTDELWQEVWHKGDPDEHMASVIIKEFVNKKAKALIYSGSHHAFTHYHQPIYDFEKKELIRLNKKRMGSIIYNLMPDRVFHVFLHSPWATNKGFNDHDYPANGAIDLVMKNFVNKRVGFDVRDTPFGSLKDDSTYYSLGYDNFTLSTFCDGYIFQNHFSDYEGCSVDRLFITEKNIQEARDYCPNPGFRKRINTPEDLLKSIARNANMKKRFIDLE